VTWKDSNLDPGFIGSDNLYLCEVFKKNWTLDPTFTGFACLCISHMDGPFRESGSGPVLDWSFGWSGFVIAIDLCLIWIRSQEMMVESRDGIWGIKDTDIEAWFFSRFGTP